MNIGTALGSLGSMGTTIAGGALGFAGDMYSANQARKAAADNREFQAEMSGTAHQREVRDLRAAGLNPILSGTGGSGSSTPSGAVAQVPQGVGERVVSSAIAARRNKAEVALLEATADKTKSEEANNQVLYNKYLEDTKFSAWNALMAEQDFRGRRVEGEIDSTEYGRFLRYLDRSMRSLTGGSSAFRNTSPYK